jgi:SAM-dependent methyltransferase
MSQTHKISNITAPKECPLCNSANIFSKGIIKYATPALFSTSIIELDLKPELWSCRDCGSGFSRNIISEEDAKFLYQQGESNNRWVSNAFEIDKPEEIVEAISPLLKPGTKVLDIGCAGGAFLDFAKQRQCLTSGLEYSQSNADVLRKKGHKAYMDMQEVTEKYDLITAFDVVEHLYDVNRFIDFCTNRLEPNGHIAIVTGDISSTSAKLAKNNWWYVSFPEHITFPSTKYFQSHPQLKDIRLVSTFANVLKKKYISQFRGFIKSIITGRFRGSFIWCDHVVIIAKSRNE